MTEQLNRGTETISYKIPQDGQTEKQEVRVVKVTFKKKTINQLKPNYTN